MEIEGFKLNSIRIDDFGRPHGILCINKPAGLRSHQLVDLIREKYSTRKVGHAGALDPFASGIMLIMVGKATKLSSVLLTLKKEYVADILLGISTETGDPEGTLFESDFPEGDYNEEVLSEALNKFMPSYEQYVPIISSVKVNGNKLRVLARKYDSFEIKTAAEKKTVNFLDAEGAAKLSLELPKKKVQIYGIDLLSLEYAKLPIISEKFKNETAGTFFNGLGVTGFQVAKVRIECSKGTYIRQMAKDIGESLGITGMLIALKRTKIGDIVLEECIEP